MTSRLVAAFASVLAIVPSLAVGGPITLSYAGTASLLSPLLAGAPINFSWTIDPDLPDICANPIQGAFGPSSGPTATMTIGGFTYSTAPGQFLLNENVSGGCNGFATGAAELRAITWSGPGQPGFTLVTGALFNNGTLPGLVFQTSALPGDDLQAFLQSASARNLTLEGPYFWTDQGRLVSIGGQVSLVPEPGTWLLLGTGLALVVGRRLSTGTRQKPNKDRP